MQSELTAVHLGKLAIFAMGQSPPSTYVSEEEIGLPFLQGNAEFGAIYPAPGHYCSQPQKLCQSGDVLISVRAPVGELNKADQTYVIGRGLAAVRFTEIPPEFGWHLLNYWARDLHKVAQGSTFKAISKGDLESLSVLLPPLHEQHRIAEVLDAADDAIRQTERVIAKLRAVKAGLLHDLLTRGLDEHGCLRDPQAHPEQFKDSPLGRIPREWKVTTLGDVIARGGGLIQTGPFGSQLHAEEYTAQGIPVIMPQDIQDNRISEDQIARIPSKKVRALARHRVVPNDVVFARRGDLARCAPIGERETGWLCGTGCLLVRPPEKVIDGYWLSAIYQRDRSQRQIAARAVGSTMVNLNTSLLASLVIAKPSYDEQVSIVETFSAHDIRIRAEEGELAKLRQVKRGLMDDLLTGRVRVGG
jgi:type I restriction enzyme S subunit